MFEKLKSHEEDLLKKRKNLDVKLFKIGKEIAEMRREESEEEGDEFPPGTMFAARDIRYAKVVSKKVIKNLEKKPTCLPPLLISSENKVDTTIYKYC